MNRNTEVHSQLRQKILNDCSTLAKKLTEEIAKDKDDSNNHLKSLLLNLGISAKTSQLIMERLVHKVKPIPTDDCEIRMGIEREIAHLLPTTGPICLTGNAPSIFIAIGSPGAGKSTLIKKIAQQYTLELKKNVLLLSWGTHPFSFTEDGVNVEKVADSVALFDRLKNQQDEDLILIDTPDFLDKDKGKLQELAWELSKFDNLHVTLVLRANTKVEEALKTLAFFAPLKPKSLAFSELNESMSLGSMIDIILESGLPVGYLLANKMRGIELVIADPDQLAKKAEYF